MAGRNPMSQGDPHSAANNPGIGARMSADSSSGPYPTIWDRPARTESFGFNGEAFRTMSANGGLRGAAASFQPNQDTINTTLRLRLLSLNTTDDTPTIVSSTVPVLKHAVQEPIGTKSQNSSPVHPKAWFTTDIDPNKPPMSGHFILVQGIKDTELHTGVVAEIQKMYREDILGSKTLKAAETGEYTDVVLYINDTQAATKIYNDLESEGMLTTSFVSHDWYNAGQGVRVGSIDAKTMYVGQVTFVAEFKGRTSEYDPSLNVYEAVRSVADSFGTVSAFEQNNNAQYPLWQFRCEFYKVTAADRAIAAAGDGMKLDGVPGWIIYANQYVPLTYGNTSKKPAELNAVQAVAVPDGAKVVMSPTGRTAWYTSPDGVVHPVPPPRPVANVERAAMETGPAWNRKEIVAYEPQLSAPPFHRRSQDTHFSIDSVLNDVRGNELVAYKDQQQNQDVVVGRIIAGTDIRTTIMLRNVPNHWNWKKLKSVLDEKCLYRYNFMYLRIDFKANKNVGYAFVNFEKAYDVINFVNTFVGKPWEAGHVHFGKPKLVQVSYATIQGLDSLIDKFRNSSIMDENVDFRPILFQTPEEKSKEEQSASSLYNQGHEVPFIVEVGEKKPFPAPNNRAKKERSTANAGQIGLFSPRTNRHSSDRFHRSQYDRGTPAQIMEDFNHGPFPGSAHAIMSPVAPFGFGAPRLQNFTPFPQFPPAMHFMSAPQYNGRGYVDTPTRPFGQAGDARRIPSALPWNGSNVAGPANYMNGHANGNGNGI